MCSDATQRSAILLLLLTSRRIARKKRDAHDTVDNAVGPGHLELEAVAAVHPGHNEDLVDDIGPARAVPATADRFDRAISKAGSSTSWPERKSTVREADDLL